MIDLNGRGIYTIILELKNKTCITIGALGNIAFPVGYYSYTGSAKGHGGFNRVKRHMNVAAGINPTRRWHVDYLLPFCDINGMVLTYTDLDLECSISSTIGMSFETIVGFGSSDCNCTGHLHFSKDYDRIISAVLGAHRSKTLFPFTHVLRFDVL